MYKFEKYLLLCGVPFIVKLMDFSLSLERSAN